MTVKTLSAPTIAAALAEARQLFGEDVVLLESHPPANGRAARITVMADAPVAVSPEAESISRVIERVKKAPAKAYGYAGAGLDLIVEDDSPEPDESAAIRPRQSGRPRGTLFPMQDFSDRLVDAAPAASPDLQALLDERLLRLHDRLEGIEKRFEGHPAAAGMWLRHPLFNRLLDRGFKPKTVTELFARIGATDPADDDAVFWALARELRSLLSPYASHRMTGAQVFIGPAGSGKTSLILRLATDPSYFGRRTCGVIVVNSKETEGAMHHDPTDLYRRHGIAVQNVGSADEMDIALQRLRGFDHVLIDTPALPGDPRAMRDALTRLRPLLSMLVPSSVHFVVDGMSAFDELDATILRRLPVVPDAIAVTRMDEVRRAGRVAEWLREAGLPVNVLGCGRSTTKSLTSFSPAAFAEQLLER